MSDTEDLLRQLDSLANNGTWTHVRSVAKAAAKKIRELDE